MGFYATESFPINTDPLTKNRVWGFRPSAGICTRRFPSQPLELHRDIVTTTAGTASGIVDWLSNDPIGISGGLNQYVFCANNPVNNIDPFGLFDAIASHNYWTDIGVAGYSHGGIDGYSQAVGASIMQTFIDFWGARTIQENAEISAYYSEECVGKAWQHGLLSGGQIALAASVAVGANNTIHPYYRYVGAGSRPLGKGAWLVRGTIGKGAPYGRDFAMAASKLQIPPVSMIDDVIRVPGVWKKFVGGARFVRGNSQWGVGGGTEYRLGMWLWP